MNKPRCTFLKIDQKTNENGNYLLVLNFIVFVKLIEYRGKPDIIVIDINQIRVVYMVGGGSGRKADKNIVKDIAESSSA